MLRTLWCASFTAGMEIPSPSRILAVPALLACSATRCRETSAQRRLCNAILLFQRVPVLILVLIREPEFPFKLRKTNSLTGRVAWRAACAMVQA